MCWYDASELVELAKVEKVAKPQKRAKPQEGLSASVLQVCTEPFKCACTASCAPSSALARSHVLRVYPDKRTPSAPVPPTSALHAPPHHRQVHSKCPLSGQAFSKCACKASCTPDKCTPSAL